MKITSKTTKEQMKAFLKDNLVVAKGDLKDRVAYALKAKDEKITRKDLVDLVKEVTKVLGTPTEKTPVEPKAENSIKKLNKNKKQEVPKESEESEETAEETEAPAKEEKPKKSKLGSKKPKKEGVKSSEVSKKSVQFAEIFPETLEVGDSKYELASDIKTMEDLHEALGKDEEIVFAFYWTKRHLRQFPYFSGYLGQPKSFDNDLDLATAIFVSDEFKISYQVSMYTEAIYAILPEDLVEENGIRISSGTEFQIYRKVVEAQETTEETAE